MLIADQECYLDLTPEHEFLLREIIMTEWQKYFTERRRRTLDRISQLLALPSLDWSDRRELARLRNSKYGKYLHAADLSGGCKPATRLAFMTFPLTGQVISNRHHTFVVLGSDNYADIDPAETIYDFNRNCRDVGNQLRKGRQSYRIDLEYHASAAARNGLGSWDQFVTTVTEIIIEQLSERFRPNRRHLRVVPAWARIGAVRL